MPQTSTGVAGTVIVAQCTVPSDGPVTPGPGGDLVTGAALKNMMDATNADLATIRDVLLVRAEDQILALAVKFPGDTPAQIETVVLAGGFNDSIVHVNFAAAKVGDVIEVLCLFDASVNDSAGTHCRIALVQDYGNTNVVLGVAGADAMLLGGSVRFRMSLGGEVTVATAGALRVKLQYSGTATATVLNYGTGVLLAKRKYLGL